MIVIIDGAKIGVGGLNGNGKPSVKEMEMISDFFKAFSDPTRLKILYSLASVGQIEVGALAEMLSMTSSAVSHQLRVLRQQRLVAAERSGKSILYRLDDGHIVGALNAAFEHISEK